MRATTRTTLAIAISLRSLFGGWFVVPFWVVSALVGIAVTLGLVYLVRRSTGEE